MKIAVLIGGDSPEREVSLSSGKNIVQALRVNNHDVIEFDPGLPTAELIKKFKNNLPDLNILSTLPGYYSNLQILKQLNVDIVFNALHGGKGENGVVQTLLDTLEIKYTGSGSTSSAIAMDKEISKMLFLNGGIPAARSITIQSEEEIHSGDLTLPVVVKPADGGSSIGNSIVRKLEELEPAVILARKYGKKTLIEEFIHGKEIAAAVLNGEALPLVHIKPTHEVYDYECKYTPGMSSYEVPAVLDDKITQLIQKYAVKAYHLLECKDYARIDFLVNNTNEIFVLEANTLPGMTATSLVPKAAKSIGISFNELIEKIVQGAKLKS